MTVSVRSVKIHMRQNTEYMQNHGCILTTGHIIEPRLTVFTYWVNYLMCLNSITISESCVQIFISV